MSDYISIRVLNSNDYNETYLSGKIFSRMSILGYVLSGFCQEPLQYEFRYDSDDLSEPSNSDIIKFLNNYEEGFEIEIERYNINEI